MTDRVCMAVKKAFRRCALKQNRITRPCYLCSTFVGRIHQHPACTEYVFCLNYLEIIRSNNNSLTVILFPPIGKVIILVASPQAATHKYQDNFFNIYKKDLKYPFPTP